MKTNRLVAAVTIAAALPLALTACGSSAPAGGSSGGAAGKGLSLTIEDYYSQPLAANYDKIYKACAAAEGDTITSIHVPGADLITKVLQQETSKTLPDVLMLDNPDVQQIASSGALTPLSDYGITGKGVEQEVLAAGSLNGKLYGLAPGVNSLALFYNKEMFAKYNLQPPKTWDDLVNIIKVLKSHDIAPFSLANKNKWTGSMYFMTLADRIGGPQPFLDAVSRKGSFDSPTFIEAGKRLQELVKMGAFAPGFSWISACPP